MKYTYKLLMLLLVAFSVSCDPLDRKLEDQLETQKYFASANAAALEQYCNYFYPRLIGGHGASGSYNYGNMLGGEFDSDNVLTWEYNLTSFGHHVAPTSKSNTDWQWENIRGCNDFLNNYHLSPEIDAIKNKYAGEILFFKSLDYFNKVKSYGDVPWYDEALGTTSEGLYKARDSRVLIVQNMIRDLDNAIAYLPKKADSKVYRVTKDAALLLKARVCLFEGTYRRYHNIESGAEELLKLAYEAAGELMKPEYGYSLYTGSKPSKAYYELFVQADYNSNSEVILSREYEPQLGKGHNVTRQIYVGETPIGMSKDAADDYLCATTGLPTSICACHKDHTTFIEELKNRDPRMLQTVATPEAGEFTYYLEGKRPAIGKVVSGNAGASSTGYSIVKYYTPTDYSSSHNVGTSDAPVMRYAEVLLIRAEAGAELGLDAELDKTINALRQRVGFNHALTENPVEDPKLVKDYPVIKGPNANLIREIRRERRIELFAEGYRRSDLMRWAAGHKLAEIRRGFIPTPQADANDLTGYTVAEIEKMRTDMGFEVDGSINIYSKRVQQPAVFVAPKNYLFAIPINEIGLNPNLVQNPGWE